MKDNLQKMINLYSLDTSCFYNKKENKINEEKLKSHKIFNTAEKLMKKYNKNNQTYKYNVAKNIYRISQKKIDRLKKQLDNEIHNHSGVRHLDPNSLLYNKLVGMFETSLTRTLGIKTNQTTEDIMIIKIYYFDIMKELIRDGFYHNGEKYIYFSSSAGQIRNEKLVFIKESLWLKRKNTITCGLSIEDINQQGGANVNKYLAYIALTNSASQTYKDFNIDKSIVVDDLETNVNSTVDHINRDTYEITRLKENIPIEHTDGAGMILPKKSKKSFMVRLPFIKGLLVPFPFDKFIREHDNASSKVKDIYGTEWDIIRDDIEIIFFKSQFKMHKYYNDWKHYQYNFKKYNCEACFLNEEEDYFKNAKLNYQMIQTLNDITDDELRNIAQPTIDEITNISDNEDIQLDILGAKDIHNKSNYFQKALNKYPELLNDSYLVKTIKDKKKSLVKNAKAAKLKIDGKYTFICPDFYAVCEKLFLGIDNPNGLLDNGSVYCNLFENKKIDCLRSPHLYREHAVRKNVVDENKSKWFITNGLYTSIHDPISRILQFDVDGDQSLVVADDDFVNIAERNMKNIYPLYYEMSVAEKEYINSENIYNSLIQAFKTNIGKYSNNITKIFNTKGDPNLKAVSWLTFENNYAIDYAKTLFMPERPYEVDVEINKYVQEKLPYFFIYAKDKTKNQVINEHRGVIDKLDKIIPNKRLNLYINKSNFDYKFLMRTPYNDINQEVLDTYKDLSKNKRKYMNRHFKNKRSKEREHAFDLMARKKILNFGFGRYEVVNMLVAALYRDELYKNKSILWNSFDKELYKNIELNTKGTKRCDNCKKRIKVTSNRTKYCSECWKEREKELKRNWWNMKND